MYDIKWQRIWFVIVTLIGVLTIPLFLLYRGHAEDLRLSFSANPCFLYRLYHLYCPGCGATRSVRFLIEGQFIDALRANPLIVFGILIFIKIWVVLLYNCTAGFKRKKMTAPLSIPEIWAIFAVVIAYGVVRDVLLVAFHIDYLGDLITFW